MKFSQKLLMNNLPKDFTWLGATNYFVLQWFFVRLAKVVDNDTHKIVGWRLIFCRPMTGWNEHED